jgi:hypothetical protein
MPCPALRVSQGRWMTTLRLLGTVVAPQVGRAEKSRVEQLEV